MTTTEEKLNNFMLTTSNQITQLQAEVKTLSELIKTSIQEHASKHEVDLLRGQITDQERELEKLTDQVSNQWKAIATGAVGIITTIVLNALNLI